MSKQASSAKTRPTNSVKSKYTLGLIASVAALCGLLFGFDTGIISGAAIFIRKSFHINDTGIELVVSAVLFGAMLGAILSGRATDRLGRRHMMLLTSILFIIGSIICASAMNMWWLASGRLVLGLAIGVACYTAPLYISEIAPTEKRGSLVVLNTIMVTGGIVIAYLVSIFLAGGGHWRGMLGAGLIPAIFLLVGVFFLPKSPRWLIERGQLESALRVLDYLRPSQHLAEQEWRQIIGHVENKKQTSWRILFSKRIRWLLILGCGLAIIQQVTGINTILYYAPYIFRDAGFRGLSAQLMATLGMGVTNLLMTVIAYKLVDKVGRRPLLLWGLSIMTLSLLLVSAVFYLQEHTLVITHLYDMRWLLLAALICFVASYALSIGCLFWLYIAEIYPLNIRGGAMSIAASCNWLANFVVAASFLSLLHHFGPHNTFLLYGLISLGSIVFCYWLAPETRGISLERIEANIQQTNLPIRKLGKPPQD